MINRNYLVAATVMMPRPTQSLDFETISKNSRRLFKMSGALRRNAGTTKLLM